MKLVIFPYTNCWRGNPDFINELLKLRRRKICDIGSTYSIAKECATADTLPLGHAALWGLINNTSVWLRDRDEILNGVVGYLKNNWIDEISVTKLEQEQKEEKQYWAKELQFLEYNFSEERNNKFAQQDIWVEGALEAREDFLEEVRKQVTPKSIDDDYVESWLLSCFDHKNDKWGGIILSEILERRGLPEDSIEIVLQRINQFPGLKLSYGNLMHSHMS